jgi:site-specific DNA-methyltransferase (adenine-specific)
MIPKLHHADFLTSWQSIEPESVALIFADPPYSLFSKLSYDPEIDLKKLGEIYNKLLKPNGQILLFCNLDLLIQLKDVFSTWFHYRYLYVLEKSSGMPASTQRPINNIEYLSVWCKKGARETDLTWKPYDFGLKGLPYHKKNYSMKTTTRGNKKTEINVNDDGNRYLKSVIQIPAKPNFKKDEKNGHPFQKHQKTCERFIKVYSNAGDTVLDSFTGSGSILAACFKTGRMGIGYEIQKKYFNHAKTRINNLTAQEVLF